MDGVIEGGRMESLPNWWRDGWAVCWMFDVKWVESWMDGGYHELLSGWMERWIDGMVGLMGEGRV